MAAPGMFGLSDRFNKFETAMNAVETSDRKSSKNPGNIKEIEGEIKSALEVLGGIEKQVSSGKFKDERISKLKKGLTELRKAIASQDKNVNKPAEVSLLRGPSCCCTCKLDRIS